LTLFEVTALLIALGAYWVLTDVLDAPFHKSLPILVLIGIATAQITHHATGKGHLFAILRHGIEDRTFGGIGLIRWDEIDFAEVGKLHGTPVPFISLYDPEGFWSRQSGWKRGVWSLARAVCRDRVPIAWIPWAASVDEAVLRINAWLAVYRAFHTGGGTPPQLDPPGS
jgi:hypothetical protein